MKPLGMVKMLLLELIEAALKTNHLQLINLIEDSDTLTNSMVSTLWQRNNSD
jgi:hypothetical protein